MFRRKTTLPSAELALPGRTMPVRTAERHLMLDTPLNGSWPKASGSRD